MLRGQVDVAEVNAWLAEQGAPWLRLHDNGLLPPRPTPGLDIDAAARLPPGARRHRQGPSRRVRPGAPRADGRAGHRDRRQRQRPRDGPARRALPSGRQRRPLRRTSARWPRPPRTSSSRTAPSGSAGPPPSAPPFKINAAMIWNTRDHRLDLIMAALIWLAGRARARGGEAAAASGSPAASSDGQVLDDPAELALLASSRWSRRGRRGVSTAASRSAPARSRCSTRSMRWESSPSTKSIFIATRTSSGRELHRQHLEHARRPRGAARPGAGCRAAAPGRPPRR